MEIKKEKPNRFLLVYLDGKTHESKKEFFKTIENVREFVSVLDSFVFVELLMAHDNEIIRVSEHEILK